MISIQTSALPAPVCLGKPGMLLDATPNTTASLALQLVPKQDLSAQRVHAGANCSFGCRRQIWCVASVDAPTPPLSSPSWLPHR